MKTTEQDSRNTGTSIFIVFFFKDAATTEIYPLSLHDALPIWASWTLSSPSDSRSQPGYARAVNVRDPVLEWRTADIAWIAQNQKLLDVVYQWFLREGDWPSVSVLRRHLARQDMTGIDVQAVADAKLLIPGQLT